jgi:hypothetical protein
MHRSGARSSPPYDGVAVERGNNFRRSVDGSERMLRKIA